jgi:hypothetical protein
MSDSPTTRGNRKTAGGDAPSVAETARTAGEEKSREEDNTSAEINRSNPLSIFRIAIDR